MHKLVCNTSPLQYLHQIGLLNIVPRLASKVVVPQAVADELAVGAGHGLDLPQVAKLDWVEIRAPAGAAILPIATDLGRGESQVLDDAHARRVAEAIGVPLTGTLGLLLDAKTAGLITDVRAALDALDEHRFRVARAARDAVLQLAGESA